MAKSRYAKTRSHRKGKKAASRRRRHRGGSETNLTTEQQQCMDTYLQNPVKTKMTYAQLNRCMYNAPGGVGSAMTMCEKETQKGLSYSTACKLYLESS